MDEFKNRLAHKAFPSAASRGRANSEGDDDYMYYGVMDPFELDVLKIIQSKAYRRLKDKTQVFCFPENPHVRTRLSHTLEVVSLATVIARILGLNVLLCQAIAHGHDIGHVPYGHMGENFIANATGNDFRHEVFGTVLAQRIERRGRGLNLTYEVLDGIRRHSRGDRTLAVEANQPLEYAVVMYADKICYTLSDANDALRYGYANEHDLPDALKALGDYQRARFAHCVFALVKESSEQGSIFFSRSWAAKRFAEVRQWMFENIYSRVDWSIQMCALQIIYDFFRQEERFAEFGAALPLALMTDREANKMANVAITSSKLKFRDVEDFGFMEILPYLKRGGAGYIGAELE